MAVLPRGAALGGLCLLLVFAPALAPVVWAAGAPMPAPRRLPKAQVDFFEQKIRPVLVHHCYECHSGDLAKAKGHFVLDTREGLRKGGESGAVIIPGNPDRSPLIEAIRYEELEMPPKEKLPDDVIEDFVHWVQMGAPDPRIGKGATPQNKVNLAEAKRYWAFQPPKASSPPTVKNTAWPRSDIDRFILARLEKEKLQPVADAGKATLIRRVTFDLIGLPPTPEEIDAFVSDSSPQALATVVDRLLASPRFGERWGRHWLDVVRYAESTGKERNIPYRFAWRYRNYVIDAFNHDTHFNRFIMEQLAGDLLPAAKDPAEHDRLIVATGMLALGPKGVNVANPEQFRMDQVDDQIDVTTRAFLGLTVACARCHDHKFDPIPTTDYYAMAGIFHSTRTFSGTAPQVKHADEARLIVLTSPANETKVLPEALKAEKARQQEIAQLKAEIVETRQEAKASTAGAKAKAKSPGKAAGAKTTSAKMAVRKEIKELEDQIEELANTPSPYTHFAMGVADAETPADVHVLDRGELKNEKAEVHRGVLTVLKTAESSQIPPRHSGRLELARWIASSDNPLTARVYVNRVWDHLFGEGLVDTVDNFGALGNEPSHPALLDHLALQFMEQKWSTKKLIRSLVLSHVYQLASEHNTAAYEKDPDNRLLWRMQRRQLDAEQIRDAMLAVSGQLSLERPEGSETMKLGNKTIFGTRAGGVLHEPNVRSIYLPILRGIVPEGLQVFDLANPNLIVGKRDVTIVPTQALYVMNNPFVSRQAEQMARRVFAQEGLSPSARIDLAYRLALGRLPSDTERSQVADFLGSYRKDLHAGGFDGNANLATWTGVCQTLFATGQFRCLY